MTGVMSCDKNGTVYKKYLDVQTCVLACWSQLWKDAKYINPCNALYQDKNQKTGRSEDADLFSQFIPGKCCRYFAELFSLVDGG